MRHFHSASGTKSDQWNRRQMVLQHIKPHNGGLTVPRDNDRYEYLTTSPEMMCSTQRREIGRSPQPRHTFAGQCGLLHSGLVAPQAAELIRVC
jgi:hypothetical protein